MSRQVTLEALESLLRETATRHHAAFHESDGYDPDWAMWYAAYLQAHLWDGTGRLPTRSELVYLLVAAERAQARSGSEEPWQRAYARHLLDGLASG